MQKGPIELGLGLGVGPNRLTSVSKLNLVGTRVQVWIPNYPFNSWDDSPIVSESFSGLKRVRDINGKMISGLNQLETQFAKDFIRDGGNGNLFAISRLCSLQDLSQTWLRYSPTKHLREDEKNTDKRRMRKLKELVPNMNKVHGGLGTHKSLREPCSKRVLALDHPLLKDYKIQIMGGLNTVRKKAHNIMQEVAVNLVGPCLLTPRCIVPILLLKMEVFACSNRLHVFEVVYQV